MFVLSKEMEEYARDCVRLAQVANTPATRTAPAMAREWMAAATDEPKAREEQDRHH